MATAAVSPMASPLLAPVQRRLSARRGSVSASDPHGTYSQTQTAPERVASKITIIRVDPATQSSDEGSGLARQRSHRRQGSGASISSNASSSGGKRMSFAFSSFSPHAPNAAPRSPTIGPVRPSSPLAGHRHSISNGSISSLPQVQGPLSPDQLCDLARQSLYGPAPQSAPTSPGGAAPSAFTALDDDQYLPFVDRPAEVASLISSAPTSKLIALLSKTFPNEPLQEGDHPKHWNYSQLEHWLTSVDRDVADDKIWVEKARTCVRARSELIWERLKGALGVPPELEDDIMAHESMPSPEDALTVEPVLASSSSTPFIETSSRMQDISEDEPGTGDADVVRGLRICMSPRSREEGAVSPDPSVVDSYSHPHIPYDVVAERGPGNPLFPSSFANLALGPTLSANNPALRSPSLPPPSAYPSSLLQDGARGSHKVTDWADGLDTAKLHEYAVTTASGSSVVGDY